MSMTKASFKSYVEGLGFSLQEGVQTIEVPMRVDIEYTAVVSEGVVYATLLEGRRLSVNFNEEDFVKIRPNVREPLYKVICEYDYTELSER